MNDPSACQPISGDDANTILARLLESLEAVLQNTREDSTGRPLFTVEAVLTGRLRAALPGVRFSPEDIRGWAAQISS
ncbi:hypothetical protein ASG92_20425 [Arthrobacter sp. Soil736]|uniref:hypothetical protein n=1 Tax=Arthrobacter sp. Soil736 TaxID=1736395 RepID=UPI0006F57370|nr:hypothetical protein [Arthrobacter sp. Soil736]KRE61760.1 hypothetical protein ASG92_20425 [Arthrobacter sp. Soil736]